MQETDNIFCLFVHTGRFRNGKADMIIMPLGFPMLAGVLEDNGFPSRIFNLTISEITGGPSLKQVIRRYKPGMVAFSLHWYQQLPFVAAEIRYIKKLFPEIRIVCGGFTSSYFAREIMSMENGPDFLIRGDGERPMLELARQIASDKPDFRKVPNLVWKKNYSSRSGKPEDAGESFFERFAAIPEDKAAGNVEQLVFNSQTYIAGSREMSELYYARYDLVLQREYVMRGDFGCSLDATGRPAWNVNKRKTVFYNPGRGCPYTCSFCGGCESAQLRINGRRGYFFKTTESALRDVKGFLEQGFETIHTCFDPEPSEKWYLDFFAAIRDEKLKMAYVFEPWGLPSEEFLKAFEETFRDNLKNCRVTVSPESGSERVRRCNKGIFYTNEELEKTVALGQSLKIPMEISFMSSLPGESAEDFLKSVQMAGHFTEKYGCEANMAAIGLEPGSPMYENPDKYGIQTSNEGFPSFLENIEGVIDWEHKDRKWGTSEKRKKYFDAKKPSRPEK